MPVTRSALARRAACSTCGRIGARHERRDLAGQRRDPLDPLGHGAELGVEGDALQLRQRGPPARTLRSSSQKNRASVRRARSTRSLPAAIVCAAVARLDVGDDDEVRRSLPSAVSHARSTSGACAWRCGSPPAAGPGRPGRCAQQRRRPFGQAGDLVQQALVLASSHLRLAAERLARRSSDDRLALGRIEHDVAARSLAA